VVTAVTQDQRDALDYVQQWLDARTVQAPSAITPTGTLWKDYAAWCADNGVTPRGINRFSKSLSKKGLEIARTNTARVIKGLGLQV
jgi:phage/plasmid-associated DNA primase